MRHTLRFLGAVFLTFLVGCASTEFRSYEAQSNVYTGSGGKKTVVDGIEFWKNGDPPRKLKVVGVIDDDRNGGWIQGMMLEGDIAAKALAAGGDAVILLSSDAYGSGYYTNGSATSYGSTTNGSAATTDEQRKVRKYIVVKYLD